MQFIIFLTFSLVHVLSNESIKDNLRVRRQLDMSYGSPAYKYCECGRRNPPAIPQQTSKAIRVVGGQEAWENEYPWMALIIGNHSRLVCGGALVNDRYVITAAHCLSLGFRQDEMKVILGEHDRCKADSRTVIFSIEELIPHPSFDEITNQADIMLIKLNMRVTFNRFVRPVCLPKLPLKTRIAVRFEGKLVSTMGWGEARLPEEVCVLRVVNLKLYKPKDCHINIPGLICAGIESGGYDSCQGDSGGPLQLQNNNGRFELIGIVSNGIGCGQKGFPGLYTDVSLMVPWITEVTYGDSMYCWR